MVIGINLVMNLWRKRSRRLSRRASSSVSPDRSQVKPQPNFWIQDEKETIMTNLDSEKLSMQEVKEIIKVYILEEFLPGENPAEMTDSTPLITGGILDSLATIKLVAFLERRFNIQIQAHETMVDYLDTISAIAHLVSSKI
jgi:acyl carrier protein